ncbi:TPA_asm: hypothetical protein HUJ06_031912 [Nelumbo nucifera]|uniref:Uncharacterized protein n=1 Tax=Nelumbo nucifera TaxID=4432 RepID=A0A823A2V5_NELNU|nr:TPA_asm: hypothetical protein HUJ06_031912 [Nelumbo nucifera]
MYKPMPHSSIAVDNYSSTCSFGIISQIKKGKESKKGQ